MKQYAALDDTIYLWFASNDTSGSGGDGASPAADVRLAGAAADAAPVYSPTPVLLTHANYPAGSYEIAITASAANGFATGNTYAVFCTLAIDSQNPTGFVGSFDLKPVESDVTQWLGTAPNTPTVAGVPEVDITHLLGTAWLAPGVAGTPDVNAKLIGATAQTGRDIGASVLLSTGTGAGQLDFTSGIVKSNLTQILAHLLTQTGTQLADGFEHFFDVGTPTGTIDSLPAAAPNAAGGLPISAAGGLDLDAVLSGNTPQTADNNTILAHADYGLAKLVRSTTPANALDVSATGEAGLDFANIKDATGAHTLTNITVPTVSTLTNKSGFALSATGANLILKDSTFALAMADAIWDEILSGATHNIAGSAGRRVREIGAYAIESGTAQAGNSHSITLSATASAADGTYNRNLIVLVDNTGVGQTRTIVDYDGTTKVAVIDRDWRTSPDATTTYQVTPDNTPLVVDQGVAQEGTSTTIKLRAYASSTNDIYLCNVIAIIAGTGRGQARLIGAYNGTTKVATICGDNWVTTPDATSVYVLMPYGTTCTSCIGTYALGLIKSENDDALTDYDPPTRTEATSDKDEIITEVDANETKIDALNDISVANIIAGITDGTLDLQEMLRIILSATAGKSSGGGTVTLVFRDSADAKDRITATVDATGNRTAMTLDGA